MLDHHRSFEALALPHLDAAYNLARWLCGSPSDADDIVQDAMLRAFRAFDGFRGDNVRGWLLVIVRNCWRRKSADSRRRRQTALPTDYEETLVYDGPDPEALTLGADRWRRLTKLVQELPADFREAFLLREIEDMSYRQIAEVTGAPIGTVMSRLARARALLKNQWRAEDGYDVP